MKELEGWLTGKLDQTPQDDPNRTFLEETLHRARYYAEHGYLSSSERLVQPFLALRSGPFLPLESLREMRNSLPHSKRDYTERSRIGYADELISGIRKHQEDSLAHLCLPRTVWWPLIRNGVNTISQLREILLLSELSRKRIPGLSGKAYEVAVQRLEDFDRLLTEYQSPNQPQNQPQG